MLRNRTARNPWWRRAQVVLPQIKDIGGLTWCRLLDSAANQLSRAVLEERRLLYSLVLAIYAG